MAHDGERLLEIESLSETIYSRNRLEPEESDIEKELQEAYSDLYELGIIIGKYGINRDKRKVKTCEEARALIQEYVSGIKSQRTQNTEYLVSRRKKLLECLRTERSHQSECKRHYESAKSCLFSQNKFVVCNLQLQCTDFEKDLLKRQRMLEEGSIRILITGEICAGKSSVLNMLMGGHYLAVGHGPCTRIPCEVINSRETKAVLIYEEQRLSPRIVNISNDGSDVVWEQLRQCLEHGEDALSDIEQRTGQKLKKICIHWKIPFLQETNDDKRVAEEDKIIYGLSFLDVPGIHDTEETFVNIQEYINSSDAFLFVINTSQHAGVDRDRLLRLMHDVRNKFEKKHGMFSPKCAMFVCNKWDNLDEATRQTLKKEIFTKLQRSWTSVSEKQLSPMNSSLEAVRRVRSRHYEFEYVHLEYSICTFIENAVRLKTEIYAWWLTVLIDKMHATVKNMENFVSIAKSKKQEIMEQLRRDEDKIVETREKIQIKERELTVYLLGQHDHLKKYLAGNLENCKKQLGAWHISSIPVFKEDNWLNTSQEIHDAIGKKLENHINTDTKVMSTKHDTDNTVNSTLNDVINLYTELEETLTFTNEMQNEKLRTLSDQMLTTGSSLTWQEIAGVVLAVVFPLAPIVMVVLETIDAIKMPSYLDDPKLFQDDCYSYMDRQTTIFIDHVINWKLPLVSQALLDPLIKNSKFVFNYFHQCLQIRHEMVIELVSDV